MILKKITGFLFLSMIYLAASSQSIYHLEYNFPGTNDTTTYHILFVRYDDGSGFVRINYQTPARENVVLQLNIQEQYGQDEKGEADTNKLVYRTTDPNFIIGNNPASIIKPVFWFNKNSAKDNFDPASVSATGSTDLKDQGKLLNATHIQSRDLEKDFVGKFFRPEESFYNNLFSVKARGHDEEEKNIKIYLLIVANTNDSSIGAASYKDMNRALYTFQDLADYLGIQIFPTKIFGTTYTKANVQKAINELKPSANDIVIFYYSGHGFRKEKDKRKYPYLDLRKDLWDDYNVYSMNIEDIFNQLRKKGARFNLVLSDCCNNFPEDVNSIGSPIPGPRGPASSGLGWYEDNCKALFFNKKRMSVLATAADVGQRASCNNDFGGFFSYFFKTSMENNFSAFKANVTWEEILQEAKKQTVAKAEHTYCNRPYVPANICKQFPYYTIIK